MQSLSSVVGDKCSGVAMMPKIEIPAVEANLQKPNFMNDSSNSTCETKSGDSSAGVCKIK